MCFYDMKARHKTSLLTATRKLQKHARMDELVEDCNGLQLWFSERLNC